MAEDGYSAEEIVEYYYTDSKLTAVGAAPRDDWSTTPNSLWINLAGTPYYTPKRT